MSIENVTLPSDSFLFGKPYTYADSYSAYITHQPTIITPLIAAKALFSATPRWIMLALMLRDKCMAPFGLKTADQHHDRDTLIRNFNGDIGEKIGLFNVLHKTAQEIIFGEDDRHLDFRVSLLVKTTDTHQSITFTTTVTIHNWMGRVYFVPVKPIHRIVVQHMLKASIKHLQPSPQ